MLFCLLSVSLGEYVPVYSIIESRGIGGGSNFSDWKNAWSSFLILSHVRHRLNKELDLQKLFGLYVYSCTHWLRPPPPIPLHLGS